MDCIAVRLSMIGIVSLMMLGSTDQKLNVDFRKFGQNYVKDRLRYAYRMPSDSRLKMGLREKTPETSLFSEDSSSISSPAVNVQTISQSGSHSSGDNARATHAAASTENSRHQQQLRDKNIHGDRQHSKTRLRFDRFEQPEEDESVDFLFPSSHDLDYAPIFHTVQKGSDTRDKFNCGKCLCSYNNHDLVRANCTSRGFGDFPKTFPKNTIIIDLSRNQILALRQSLIVVVKSLQTLNMRFNNIREIDNDASIESLARNLDLGYNRIETLDKSTFSFLPYLRNLSLQHNHITHISNETFLTLSNLHILDLSFNEIISIDSIAFDALTNLRELYLHQNKKLGYAVQRFPPRLFDRLKKLKILFIQGNAGPSTCYPLKALEKITSLRHLNIDIVHNPVFLGPEMLKLKELITLQIGPFALCRRCPEIPAHFFQYVPYLTTLLFDGCYIHEFNPEAFADLPQLKNLSFINMDLYTLKKAFQDLRGLQNSSLQYLTLSQMGERGVPPCLSLNGADARYIRGLPLLELDLSKNLIAIVQNDFIDGLPTTLKKLTLSDNKMTIKSQVLTRIYRLEHLEELDVSYQNLFHEINSYIDTQNKNYPSAMYGTENCPVSNDNVRNIEMLGERFDILPDDVKDNISITTKDDNNVRFQLDEDTDTRNHSNSSDENDISMSGDRVLRYHVPNSLAIFKAPYYPFMGYHALNRNAVSNVKYLFLSDGILKDWGHKRLPRSVTFLDVSENYCRILTPAFFPKNNSLEHISMASNLLGIPFSTLKAGHFFKYLNRTRYMDISLNFIYSLPYTFLRGLTTLDTLRMTDNRLQILNISFAETPRLRFLDVRRNSISWISRQTRKDLDMIATKHHLTIALEHNPLACTCEGMDMIHWLWMTNVHLLDKAVLQCRDEYGDIHFMGDLSILHKKLEVRCADTTSIVLSLSVSVSFFILIIVCYYIGKKYRWWFYVKYRKNVWFAKHFGFKPKTEDKPATEYLYDAYLCCPEEDRSLARQIADRLDNTNCLFIPFRHILPGMDEVGGMTSGILNSNKFLLVFSENFKHLLRTDFKHAGMLEYTINSALFQERSSRRKFLHVVMFSDTDNVQIPLYLAHILSDPDRRTTFPLEGEYATLEVLDSVWHSLSVNIKQGNKGEPLLSSTTSSSE